jgi:hypothetical protein
MDVGDHRQASAPFPSRNIPATHFREAWVRDGQTSCSTGVQTSQRPSRSILQHRLYHQAPLKFYKKVKIILLLLLLLAVLVLAATAVLLSSRETYLSAQCNT